MFFFPDYRNWKQQHYCGKPDCRQASKLASQRRWYRKPKNLSYFRNGEGTDRVRTWRKAHPGYWRQKTRKYSAIPPPLEFSSIFSGTRFLSPVILVG